MNKCILLRGLFTYGNGIGICSIACLSVPRHTARGDWAGCYQRYRLMLYTLLFHYKPGHTTHRRNAHYPGSCNLRGVLQTSGGLTVMLKYAEKFLRNNPKHITILAPVTTWFLTVLCGTGHVVYTMFPIIYDISIKQNIRPERPMGIAVIASQQAITASPISAATVAMLSMLAGYNISLFDILKISIPCTLAGVLLGALYSMKSAKN